MPRLCSILRRQAFRDASCAPSKAGAWSRPKSLPQWEKLTKALHPRLWWMLTSDCSSPLLATEDISYTKSDFIFEKPTSSLERDLCQREWGGDKAPVVRSRHLRKNQEIQVSDIKYMERNKLSLCNWIQVHLVQLLRGHLEPSQGVLQKPHAHRFCKGKSLPKWLHRFLFLTSLSENIMSKI